MEHPMECIVHGSKNQNDSKKTLLQRKLILLSWNMLREHNHFLEMADFTSFSTFSDRRERKE